MLLLLCCAVIRAESFIENFESGLPTSASSSETQATLASGLWTLKGVCVKKDNGSQRAAMSTMPIL